MIKLLLIINLLVVNRYLKTFIYNTINGRYRQYL